MRISKINIVFGLIVVITMMGGAVSFAQNLSELTKAEYRALVQVKKRSERVSKAAGCQPGSAAADLNLNNVRANIHSYGDMWYEKVYQSSYIVPKNQEAGVLSTGGLWLAGTDVNGQKKVAALTYGLDGQDWWPGPLQLDNASISAETCLEYDRIFDITRPQVLEFIAWKENPEKFEGYTVPDIILNWPAHGGEGEDPYLAPFYDGNGDLKYDPLGSPPLTPDYPWYDIAGTVGCDRDAPTTLFGDQTLWWIFNDAGNAHTESNGQQIGMEIRAQAFCFATNDELNNMTFYNFEMRNRSSFVLEDTYFAIFAETDIGAYDDDYIGCHIERGLAFCYNGDAVDGPQSGYNVFGESPPAIGIDYFEGPWQDEDEIDNEVGIEFNEALNGIGYGDGIIDNERYGMRRFIYVDFQAGATGFNGPPQSDYEFYNIMRGIWRDQTPMIHGGTGHNNPVESSDVETDFAFPGNSDALHWGTRGEIPSVNPSNWTELTSKGGASNAPGDRASVQSSGPFTLDPGEWNDITYGIVYARTTSGDPYNSVELLFLADDKAQRLFDNCFKVLEGPHAPDVEFAELDEELVIYISNSAASNNYREIYEIKDPAIIVPDSIDVGYNTYYESNHDLWTEEFDSAQLFVDYSLYKFQGYQIYQVRDAAVSVSDLANSELARLAYQCDKSDGYGKMVNYVFDEAIEAPVPSLMVDGADEGVRHSFKITTDLFAAENKTLVNNKAYYFIAIAYAHNNFKDYDPLNPLMLDGQQTPYLASRQTPFGSIQTFSAIPHKQVSGTIVRSGYGQGPPLTRLEGQGNGGNVLNISDSMRNEVLNAPGGLLKNITYESGSGPIDVKIINPLNVPDTSFTFQMLDNTAKGDLDSAEWKIWMDGSLDTVYSTVSIATPYEQLIPEWGISIRIRQGVNPGILLDEGNGLLGSSIEFADSSNQWLEGVADVDAANPVNWIRSGQVLSQDEGLQVVDYPEGLRKKFADPLVDMLDPWEEYEGVVDGWFAPYVLAA
ncbi:MAG: T9SS C-terminal target domain-containing protein, partial [Flavobacteriales bacterium]|nr:T9SS C-terminal target domain-containing protein [Flavobacteriales bacterium]